jgi:uncharacterized protein (DUF1778 family)
MLSSDVRALLEVAAAERNQTVEAFAVAAIAHGAWSALSESQIQDLTAHDFEQLMGLLDNPSEPNAALLTAAEQYFKRVKSDVDD